MHAHTCTPLCVYIRMMDPEVKVKTAPDPWHFDRLQVSRYQVSWPETRGLAEKITISLFYSVVINHLVEYVLCYLFFLLVFLFTVVIISLLWLPWSYLLLIWLIMSLWLSLLLLYVNYHYIVIILVTLLYVIVIVIYLCVITLSFIVFVMSLLIHSPVFLH